MLTDELIKALSLSDEQVEKWKEIESGLQEKMEAMRPDRNSGERPDPEKMREKMDSMMQAYDAAVKEILSDEQYEQLTVSGISGEEQAERSSRAQTGNGWTGS